jgi:hypothetical protein
MVPVVCLIVLGLLPAVGAQQETRTFHDPHGLFSINLPADWKSSSDPARSLGASFIRGFERSDSGGMVRSTLAADGPISSDDYALPFIGMLALELPRSLSPRAFGEIVKTHVPSGWTQTRDGDAKISGRNAYFQYMTRGDLYAVVVFIPTPTMGYLLMAGTLNQPERVNADFATISQILESLRPQ